MTVQDKIAQGNDTNRGFCRILPNAKAGDKLHMWGTLNVFVMPEIAEGKECRYVQNNSNPLYPLGKEIAQIHSNPTSL